MYMQIRMTLPIIELLSIYIFKCVFIKEGLNAQNSSPDTHTNKIKLTSC